MKKKIASAVLVIGILPFIFFLCFNEPRQTLPADLKAEKIVIEKSKRKLHLLRDGKIIKTYEISLGRQPVGPKLEEGDNKTPEGLYFIDSRNPNSQYHLSLHISYPNKSDVEKAKGSAVSSGGDIMIHGIRNGLGWIGELHLMLDWTQGCIAVTNQEIEEIWRVVPNGTPVEIIP